MSDRKWCRDSGERLRQIREQLRYTQEHVAHLADVSVVTFKRWELGLQMPEEATCERIYKALGVPAWQILYGPDLEWTLPV